MAMHPAGEIITNGITVPVEVDDETGNWVTTYGGQRLSADTQAKLKGKLSRLTKIAKTEVEVRIIEVTHKETGGITHRRGTATGLHGANGNVLVIWDAIGSRLPAKQQLSGWSSGSNYVAGGVTDEELKQYAVLVIAEAEAKIARSKWWGAHKIVPKTAVHSTTAAGGRNPGHSSMVQLAARPPGQLPGGQRRFESCWASASKIIPDEGTKE